MCCWEAREMECRTSAAYTWLKSSDQDPRHQVRGIAQAWLSGDIDDPRAFPVLSPAMPSVGGDGRHEWYLSVHANAYHLHDLP